MKTVAQVEYVGDLAPYDVEKVELTKADARLVVVDSTLRPEALVDQLQGAQVIWLEWTPPLTRQVLTQLGDCELVMRWGVGYDQIDVTAATELGIAVANTPSYCTTDVAEHALALMLAVSRQVQHRHEQMRAGRWRVGPPPQRRVAGATVGVVGLGRIGQRVATLVSALGAHVVGYDPADMQAPGVERVSLDELFARSDYVTLHAPAGSATRHLVGAARLAQMKPGAVLVNTSRGSLVDQAALIAALESGHLLGAALDVFETEPLPAEDPIRAAPRIVLSPHEAAASPPGLADLRLEMCQTTTQWLTTGWADAVVNPQVGRNPRVIQRIVAAQSAQSGS